MTDRLKRIKGWAKATPHPDIEYLTNRLEAAERYIMLNEIEPENPDIDAWYKEVREAGKAWQESK